jgi:hypothetical protein
VPRITPFSPGRRWYCDRSKSPTTDGRCPFTFVIIGPTHDNRPGYKLCRIEHDRKWLDARGYRGFALKVMLDSLADGVTQEFSHVHLKRYATLVPL